MATDKIYLTLEDGAQYCGRPFGAAGEAVGEVVFNTGMTGYQEVLTDPSYCGQLVVMTYPLIGNYGINEDDIESGAPQVSAYIVRELCDLPNNWKNKGTLEEYLIRGGIVGMQGIDTRALTRRLREKGSMRGIITRELPTDEQLAKMRGFENVMPVDKVTCAGKYAMGEGGNRRVAVIDLGVKRNILRSLVAHGCTVTVYPARTSAEEILAGKYAGVMLTNGPGDPAENLEVIENVRKLIASGIPIFGICLGHQILAIANGAQTVPLKYGHRGTNHPVKDLNRDRVFITSQNHGYTILPESLPDFAEISHVSLNDGTIEGVRYHNAPAFSVQFHPEASPGPQDTAYLFDDFLKLMDERCK